MKTMLLFGMFLLSFIHSRAQNTDLPSPNSNNQTLPAGSYVIAMDNTNQLNNSNDFNLKAYGLVVHLLNNNVKVKWVIKAGKTKDSSDFSVNAVKIKPVAGTAATFYFKAGPFVIFATDTTGVAALINSFNAGISNTNDKIKVYKTNAAVTVDVRYNLTGFIPKAAILDDGASTAIHVANMTTCNVTTANYKIAIGTDLLTDCYTFASEAHNTNTGSNVDNAISSIHRFCDYGGNFLAQCHSIDNYENNTLGHFQSSGNVTIQNYNGGTNITYGNPDLSYSQYEGAFSISKGGSLKNWSIPSNTGVNNFHKHARANGDTTVIGASVSKLKTGSGGLVFFLGNHRFDDDITTLSSINGLRMYMNAFLTPVSIANNCSIGVTYIYPLSLKVLKFEGVLFNGLTRFNWEIYQNETIQFFELQSSLDGSHFTSAGIIPGNRISGNQKYFYPIPQGIGLIYYRLKLVDFDQAEKYSRIVILGNQPQTNNGFKILSNPIIEDRLTFRYTGTGSEKLYLRIIALDGVVKFKQELTSINGKNDYSVLLPSAIPDGIYLAELISPNGRMTQKFIK